MLLDENLFENINDQLTEDSLEDSGISKIEVSKLVNSNNKFKVGDHIIKGKDLVDYFDEDEILTISYLPGEIPTIIKRNSFKESFKQSPKKALKTLEKIKKMYENDDSEVLVASFYSDFMSLINDQINQIKSTMNINESLTEDLLSNISYSKTLDKNHRVQFMYDKDIDKNIDNIEGNIFLKNLDDAFKLAPDLLEQGYQVTFGYDYSYDTYRFDSLADFKKFHSMSKNESLTEDIDDVVVVDIPDVITDVTQEEITPKGPEIGEDTGVANTLLDLINGENNTIADYNGFIATVAEFHPEFIPVIEDITNEENNHVGMLQTLLQQISPNVQTIEQGQLEAEKDLIDDSNDFEVPDFDADDSFDDGFGGIYL